MALVVKDGKDDLEVPEDDAPLAIDPNTVSGSRGKQQQEVDELGLLTDGPEISPVDCLKPGFIDVARLSAGTCIGMQSL